jgi:hypothetical protein
MKLYRFKEMGAVVAAGLLTISGGCGGGSASPTTPSTPKPTPSATSTPPPTSPIASVDAVCRAIGYGKPKVGCDHVEVATVLPLIETAIDKVVQAHPEIFDKNSQMGDNGFRVLDEKAYFDLMQTTLAGMGVCSQSDNSGTNLIVKNDNDLDETYAILNSKGFIRRGWGSYLKSCIPSSFPLSPEDQFSYVRTAFFGFQCAGADVKTPIPALGELPVVCSGIVTATPKDANGVNTPPSIHGKDISWQLRSGAENVSVYPPLDGNTFNYIVQARAVGTFSLCATVGGKEGCLNGRVVPYP